MKLIFIRHGDAGAYTLPDSERQLSALGQSQAMATGQWLTQFLQEDVATQLIASPYKRAQRTATLIGQALGKRELPDSCMAITPEDDAKRGIQALVAMMDEEVLANDGVVVVVCHMNIIAKMVALLTDEPPQAFALAEARVLDGAPLLGEMSFVTSFAP